MHGDGVCAVVRQAASKRASPDRDGTPHAHATCSFFGPYRWTTGRNLPPRRCDSASIINYLNLLIQQ